MPLKIIVLVVLFLLPITPTFWAIQDIPRRRFPNPKNKVVWFLVVSTIPCLGAIFYILFARRHTAAADAASKVDNNEYKEVT